MIRVQELAKLYVGGEGEVHGVDGISFNVAEGEFFTLLGPSGCGKTTTLRCVAGLERPDAGSIELGGEVVASDRRYVPTHRRNIGMVFQSYAVWPHMTVFQNAAFPLRISRGQLKEPQLRQRVHEVLEMVGLGAFEDRMATQLSGGQQQRLSLARAIVREPKVLLLDEPLSNLDAKLRERMRAELSIIQQRLGLTTLFVTHDQTEALSMSDRIAVMNRGRIEQVGTPREVYLEPASEFVAGFIGNTNLIRGTVVGLPDHETARVRTPMGEIDARRSGAVTTADEVALAIRPEDIDLKEGSDLPDGDPNRFLGQVDVSLFGGTAIDYHVRSADQVMRVKTNPRRQYPRGTQVILEIPPSACRVLRTKDGDPPTANEVDTKKSTM